MKMENEATKTGDTPTKWSTSVKVNDIGFRLILVPCFGIVIPIATRMISQVPLSLWQTKFAYIYTIGIAFIIWEGNRYLLFTLRSYFNWFKTPVQKIVVLFVSVSFYTIPVTILLMVGWYYVFNKGVANWPVITESTLIVMICVVFIVHVYETFFLVKESENEMLKNVKLERAKAEAELEALKTQIDPHFIFNSLNTLSHLIEEKPQKAKQFNDNLADVYRYILHNKGRELVLLREEITFLEDYFSLLKIRFEKAVQLELSIEPGIFDQYVIPPISLQVLAENAIKHNEFSDASPLVLSIILQDDQLQVRNQVRKKMLRKPSSRIGLNNLNERYKLTTGREIGIVNENNYFVVSLPVLKIV